MHNSYARLNQKCICYAIKYAQYIHGVIPAKDLNGKYGFPSTSYVMATNRKPPDLRVF